MSPFFPDFARAVAARPIAYAAVLRMKPDSSSVLNSRSRPRQHLSGGLVTPDWPAFSGHPLSALSLLGSQEDYRSEGKANGALKATLCLLLSGPKLKSFVLGVLKFNFRLANKLYRRVTNGSVLAQVCYLSFFYN